MNKPLPIPLSDGRTWTIDHAAYPKWAAEQSDVTLFHIIRDARQAEVAMPDGPKAGYYADEVHYCASEVASRRGARAALDLGKRAGLLRQSQPTVRPSSIEEVNRTLVGQAQGGMAVSPDGTANRRQVKELQVKKHQFKAGDEVVLARPDGQDRAEGLGEDVLGTVLSVEAGLLKVEWKMNDGKTWYVIDSQVDLFKAARTCKPGAWKVLKATKKAPDYLVAQTSNKGIFIKGKDGQDVYVHLGYNGDVLVTIWGGKGKVDMRVDDRLTLEQGRF